MRILHCIFLVTALQVFPAAAQVGTTGACLTPNPQILSISPTMPVAGQPIVVSVRAGSFAGNSINAQVSANTIDVTMSGVTMGFSPPPWCGSVNLGSLPSQSYQVNYYLVRDGGAPTLQATLEFSVADIIPTMTIGALFLLAALLAVLAFANRSRLVSRSS